MNTYFSNWIILYPIAFSLFVALRLSQASRDDGQRTSVILLIRLFVFLLFLFALAAIGIRSSGLSTIWGLMLVVLSLVFWWKNRRLDRSAMLLTIMNTDTSTQRIAAAEAFYHNNFGFVRRRGAALYHLFSSDVPWAQALERTGVAKSVYERLAARLQSRYGAKLSRDQVDPDLLSPMQIEQEVERTLGRLMIFSWVMVMVPVIGLFLTFIIPTFVEMFDEFGMTLPPIMQVVTDVGDNFVNFGWSVLLVLLPLSFFALVGVAILLWIFPQWTRLPFVRRLFRDYYRNVGFTALASAADFEPNLPQACYATAELVPVGFVAQRYFSAANMLNGGTTATQAFLSAGLLNRREIEALGMGLESQNPTWGLQQLASWRIERMLHRYSILIQWAVVLVTLMLGLIVGAIAAGVLQSLAMMVLELAENVQ